MVNLFLSFDIKVGEPIGEGSGADSLTHIYVFQIVMSFD